MIRVVREPVDQTIEPGHELYVFVDGKLLASVPITAMLPNIRVYERLLIGSGGLDPPRGESASKPDTTAIARRVLNLIDEDELRLRASLGMTAMFVEYVANVKDGASVYRFEVLAGLRSKGRKAEMVLKWLGIGSVRDGRLRDAYSYFEQLSQLDPIGSFYAAMTLAKMGELERGRTVIRALPEHIATHRGLIQDCERLFGSETVTSVLVR